MKFVAAVLVSLLGLVSHAKAQFAIDPVPDGNLWMSAPPNAKVEEFFDCKVVPEGSPVRDYDITTSDSPVLFICFVRVVKNLYAGGYVHGWRYNSKLVNGGSYVSKWETASKLNALTKGPACGATREFSNFSWLRNIKNAKLSDDGLYAAVEARLQAGSETFDVVVVVKFTENTNKGINTVPRKVFCCESIMSFTGNPNDSCADPTDYKLVCKGTAGNIITESFVNL